MRGAAISIAWRNVLRNRRRSLLTAAAIAIGLTALIFLWGFNDGAHNAMMRNYQQLFVGALQVHGQGYFQHPKLATHIRDAGAVTQALEAAGVRSWTPRLTSFALAAGGETSAGVMLVGIDPEREPRVTRIAEHVTEGRFLRPGDELVCVLGAASARKLRVDIGDEVVLLSQDRLGALAAERLRLVGIITGGDPALERGTLFAPLGTVQTLLAMEGRVTGVVARIEDERLEEVTAELRRGLDGQGLEVLRWFDMFPIMKEWVALDNGFYYIFLGIVLVIVVAGVINTVLISMIERTREFGVLMALGTRRAGIAAIVAGEAVIIGLIGTASGCAAGLALVALFGEIGIDLSAMAETLSRFYMDPVIYTEIDADHLVITVLATLAATTVSAVYPAIKAVRLEPAEAIRHLG